MFPFGLEFLFYLKNSKLNFLLQILYFQPISEPQHNLNNQILHNTQSFLKGKINFIIYQAINSSGLKNKLGGWHAILEFF